MDIFQYSFMQKAFVIGILIAVTTAVIGVNIVLKRLSMIGDALSHTSLAGVAVGLVCGFNPILTAVLLSAAASVGIELFRSKFPRFSEISISIIFTVGVGVAGVLSGFIKDPSSFNSFLFGSIVAVTDIELYTVIGLTAAVLLLVTLLHKELFFITFDEEAARLIGVPVNAVNFIFMLITAITVSVSARTVGALIVSSLMVIPVACAILVSGSYKQTIFYSIIFSTASTITGLFLSYYFGLKPGSTIVLICIVILIATLCLRGKRKAKTKSKTLGAPPPNPRKGLAP